MQKVFVEFGVVALMMVFMVAIGTATKKLNSNTDDFFRGGCKATWWLVGMGAFMSAVSAYTFTGIGGMAYLSGWSVLGLYFGGIIALFLHFVFLAAWFRQLRVTTFPEALRTRFGPVTEHIFAFTMMFMYLVGASVWVLGLSFFSSAVFGIPVLIVIPVVGLTALAYATTGGRWAVLATDFVQGVILVVIAATLTVLCLVHTGGVGGFFAAIRDGGLSEAFQFVNPAAEQSGGQFSLKWIFAMGILQFTQLGSLFGSVRYFSVTDGRAARRAALLTLCLLIFTLPLWFIPPMTARIFFEPLVGAVDLPKPQEAAYAVVSMQLLPAGLVGMMVFAMFAATLSSLDTALNGNAAIMVRNVLPLCFRKLGRELPDENRLLIWSRYLTIVFGVMVVGFAMLISLQDEFGIFDVAIALTSNLAMPMAIPLMLGLFLRKAPGWSCLAAAGAALVPPLAVLIWPDLLTFNERVFVSAAVGIVVFALTTLFPERGPKRQRIEGFFDNMHRPVDYEKEVGQRNDTEQLRLIGFFAIAIGGFLLVLLVLPNSGVGRLAIGGAAAAILVTGLLFRWRSRCFREQTD